MVRLSPFTFRVVGETARGPEEAALTSAREDRDHVGLFLQEARAALGRDVDEIALALRIRPEYLEAIEEGRFSDLPGPTYAIGFIRTYADFLGLDAVAIVARFKSEALSYSSAQPELDFIATPEGRFPGGALVFLGVLLAIGGVVGWSYLGGQSDSVVERVAEPPAFAALPSDEGPDEPEVPAAIPSEPAVPTVVAVAPPPDPPSSTSVRQPDVAVVANQPPETEAGGEEGLDDEPVVTFAGRPPVLPTPAVEPATDATSPASDTAANDELASVSPGAAVAAEPEDAPAVSQVASLPAVPAVNVGREGGRAYGQANANARIVLTAIADSWVQVRDERQNVLLTRMLQPGDSYRVPDRRGLTLLTGNAGGLRIEVDGDEIGQLGPKGAVRRDISLDPDALKSRAN